MTLYCKQKLLAFDKILFKLLKLYTTVALKTITTKIILVITSLVVVFDTTVESFTPGKSENKNRIHDYDCSGSGRYCFYHFNC